MRFGLFFLLEKPADGNDVDVYGNTMEQIRLADELGYDYIWLAEHRFTRYGIAPDVLVLAGAAASVTRHVRIGTAVIVLPFHNPVLLAEQVAMVDVLSNVDASSSERGAATRPASSVGSGSPWTRAAHASRR